jgi:hypothetical protein
MSDTQFVIQQVQILVRCAMQSRPREIVDMEDSQWIALLSCCARSATALQKRGLLDRQHSVLDFAFLSFFISLLLYHRDPSHVSNRQRLRRVILSLRPQRFRFSSLKHSSRENTINISLLTSTLPRNLSLLFVEQKTRI